MLSRIISPFLILCALASGYLPIGNAQSSQAVKIRFGSLPVLQALPLYVAQDKGFFAKANVDIEIIPFNTAAEKEIALTSASIDGYFGDIVTPVVLKGNGRDILIIAANYDTRFDRRMFAVMGKPGGRYRSVSDLSGVPVAVSSNSVIEYVTEMLLKSGGLSRDKIATVEFKNIPLRMQMLLTGQVEAATLPEPLVTAAQARGAVVLTDDAGFGSSQTVLVFSATFARERSSEIRAFLNAINEASRFINSNPDEVRPIMVDHVRLPESLKGSYPVPRFPDVFPPDREAVIAIIEWLRNRNVIQSDLDYDRVVDVSFIP